MSLALTTIHEAMVRQFTTSSASTRFNNDFVQAVNNVIDDLYATGALEDLPDHIESPEETIAEFRAEHSSCIIRGLIYHLIRMGQKHSGIEREEATRDWEDAKGDFMVIERRALASTVDADDQPTEDIVGLGYLGDG